MARRATGVGPRTPPLPRWRPVTDHLCTTRRPPRRPHARQRAGATRPSGHWRLEVDARCPRHPRPRRSGERPRTTVRLKGLAPKRPPAPVLDRARRCWASGPGARPTRDGRRCARAAHAARPSRVRSTGPPHAYCGIQEDISSKHRVARRHNTHPHPPHILRNAPPESPT